MSVSVDIAAVVLNMAGAVAGAVLGNGAPPVSVRPGGSVTQTLSAGARFPWLKNGPVIEGATSQTFVASNVRDHRLIVTEGGYSTVSAATPVSLTSSSATPTITTSGPTAFCEGGSVTLTSSASAGNQWLKDGALIDGATNQTYEAMAAGDYSVRVTESGGSSTSAAVTVSVTVLPPKPTITASRTTFCGRVSLFRLTSSASEGNQWFLNGVPINRATYQTLPANAAGDYTVLVTVNGCSAMSDPTTVTVLATPSLSPEQLQNGTQNVPYSATFTSSGGTGLVQYTASGTLPTGLSLTGATLSGTPTVAGDFTFSVTASDENGCGAVRSYTLTIIGAPGTAPANVTASATHFTRIEITWTPVAGANWYEVLRTSAVSPPMTQSAYATTFADTAGVVSGAAYVYRVRAVANGVFSAYSIPDLATAHVYYEFERVVPFRVVSAAHIAQLRTGVAAVRVAAGLAPFPFTDADLQGTTIRAVHIRELREALAAARARLGLPAVSYSGDASVGSIVRAADVQELRDGIR